MAERSGQKAVALAGTAERLHAGLQVNPCVMIKALPANTDVVYVGDVNGDVSSSNGLPLSKGEAVVLDFVGNLSSIWVDAAVGGEGVAWLVLDV